MPHTGPEQPSRRHFLRLAAASGLGGLLLACGSGSDADEAATPTVAAALTTATPQPAASATAEATAAVPPPRPRLPLLPRPAGRQELPLMHGTEWETLLVAQHSGQFGPSVMVLGGVHGNEPGGWLAAEEITGWRPSRGSLVVVPRANLLATRLLERTTDELGDLNRLYPGSFDHPLPMARMAAHIVDAARYFEVELVLDLHESWGFYVERGDNGGTAFIGQTITSGPGPDRTPVAGSLASAFNAQVEIERDHLIPRERRSFGVGPAPGEPLGDGTSQPLWRPGGGSSSLSLGSHVENLTPVLIEMGQQNQAVARRAELHLLLTQTALEMKEML